MKDSGKSSQKNSNESEKPIFNPRDLVQAVTRKNAQQLILKKRAIVVFDRASLDFLKERTGAKLNNFWRPYRKIYELPDKDTVLVRSLPSSPNIAVLTEELSEFGSTEIVLYGLCGSIAENLSIGDLIIVKGAICDDGTSRLYNKKNESILFSNWFKEWKGLAENRGFISGNVWTTDGLYREISSRVEYFRKKGAHAVDMEVASFYAVCNYRKVKGIAFLLTSDTLRNGTWIPGFDSKEFRDGKDKMLRFLLDECVL